MPAVIYLSDKKKKEKKRWNKSLMWNASSLNMNDYTFLKLCIFTEKK